jgi:hypothetical protein
LDYNFPGNGKLMHITAGKYHPITRYGGNKIFLACGLCPPPQATPNIFSRYNYNNYIGGVLLMTIADFRKVNFYK